MNKRIKNKQEKRVHNRKHVGIFNELEKHFTISEKNFGNGNVFHYVGINAICHFKVRELPGWLFGTWLDGDKTYFIWEHESSIEKFRPYEAYGTAVDDVKILIDNMRLIREFPKHQLVNARFGGVYYAFNEEMKHGYQAERFTDPNDPMKKIVIRNENKTQDEYVVEKYLEYMNRTAKQREKYLELYREAFYFFKTLPSFDASILAVGINDFNTGVFKASPRFGIYVHVKKGVDLNKLSKELDSFIREKHRSDKFSRNGVGFALYMMSTSIDVVDDMHYIYRNGGR